MSTLAVPFKYEVLDHWGDRTKNEYIIIIENADKQKFLLVLYARDSCEDKYVGFPVDEFNLKAIALGEPISYFMPAQTWLISGTLDFQHGDANIRSQLYLKVNTLIYSSIAELGIWLPRAVANPNPKFKPTEPEFTFEVVLKRQVSYVEYYTVKVKSKTHNITIEQAFNAIPKIEGRWRTEGHEKGKPYIWSINPLDDK